MTEIERKQERKLSVHIEEHQNKENENPVIKRPDKDCCKKCKVESNEWRQVPKLDSAIKVPKDVCSLMPNEMRGSYVPQRVRVKMGTKALSDIQKENVSEILKLSECSTPVLSHAKKPSAFSDIYVLSK